MRDYLDWPLEYAAGAPPLPKRINATSRQKEILRSGAYFVRIDPFVRGHDTPSPPKIYAGILRVRHDSKLISASGDLYACLGEIVNKNVRPQLFEKDPIKRIQSLQFPKEDYRYYLRLSSIRSRGNYLELELESFEWVEADQRWELRWPVTLLVPARAPTVAPLALKKELMPCRVLNNSKIQIAEIRLVWISENVRHAAVKHHDIDVSTSDDGQLWDQATWCTALMGAGWSVTLEKLDLRAPESRVTTKFKPAKDHWTRRRLNRYHDVFIEGQLKLEAPWSYYFLVVDDIRIGDVGSPSGLMYDVGAKRPGDSPRRGAAIAAKRITKSDKSGKALMDLPDHFNRTALHEFGHMQGLFHNHGDRGIMWPHRRLGEVEFDKAQDLVHSRDDAFRLWHLPDLWVRPGGLPYGHHYKECAIDVLDLIPESKHLDFYLEIKPHMISARFYPTELALTLVSRSNEDVLCPFKRHAQPEYNRLGVRLRTPSGQQLEVWPVRYPRELSGLGTNLVEGDSVYFSVPWNESVPLIQPGLYQVEAHLMWIVPAEEKQGAHEFYRVSASQELLVT